IPFFVSTDEFAARRTYLLGAETALNLGPLNLQSEYMMVNVDREDQESLRFWGGYVQASLFLTGENRVYRQNRGTYGRVRPYENFFSVQQWVDDRLALGRGAWQIAARLSHIDLNNGNIEGGRLTDLTLGLNWYLNRRTRVQFNYIRPMLDYRDVSSNADILAARFSLFF
ncbi:MAG: porin, partial [Planctomycetia bacterium]|nr:porin [Planctomycetia bacterium]